MDRQNGRRTTDNNTFGGIVRDVRQKDGIVDGHTSLSLARLLTDRQYYEITTAIDHGQTDNWVLGVFTYIP